MTVERSPHPGGSVLIVFERELGSVWFAES
jgi:hypothetical protein